MKDVISNPAKIKPIIYKEEKKKSKLRNYIDEKIESIKQFKERKKY